MLNIREKLVSKEKRFRHLWADCKSITCIEWVSESQEVVTVDGELWGKEILSEYVLLTWTWHVGTGKAFSASGSGNRQSLPLVWVAELTAFTETINHSFFLQEDCGLWLLPSRELPLLKSPPGLAVDLQPASLLCCIKCTRWGCGLLLLAHLHQSARLTWSP